MTKLHLATLTDTLGKVKVLAIGDDYGICRAAAKGCTEPGMVALFSRIQPEFTKRNLPKHATSTPKPAPIKVPKAKAGEGSVIGT